VVARLISRSQSAFSGIRRLNPATDIWAVAHLLEEAFRPDHNFPFANIPLLREVGIALWTINYMTGFYEATDGFVWIEDECVVGNVTLAPDRTRSNCYYVSNVAVKSAYRRQGIARALMQATIDYVRERRAECILLNVRPTNPGAIELYHNLGFVALEMRGEWKLDSLAGSSPSGDVLGLRPLKSADQRAVTELIRAATPEKIQRSRSEPNEFELAWDTLLFERLGDCLTGRSTRRWVLERAGAQSVAGLLFVRGKRIGLPHKFVIQVHPDFRGRVEEELVSRALHTLKQFPPGEIRAQAVDTHPELIAALEQNGLRFLNGLTLMELTLDR